jgi:hypothetical protein
VKPRPPSTILADLEPPAASTAQAEQDLRRRLSGKVRHGRLWSVGTSEEQLALDLDEAERAA